MLIILQYWKQIAIALSVIALLSIVYLKGKGACEAQIIQEKVIVYEKAQGVKTRVSRLPDGDALKRLRTNWQR